MANDSSSLFALAPKRMQWLATRQKAISENIANADTAGFRAKDVESFAQYLEGAQRSGSLDSVRITEAAVNWGTDMSGNNVVLEEQIIEANSNAGQFKMAIGLYRKAHEMIYAVAGRR